MATLVCRPARKGKRGLKTFKVTGHKRSKLKPIKKIPDGAKAAAALGRGQ
jgi:hypothetical protein